jgi:hypothetical protein
MVIQPGTRIGRYEVQRKLGRGGMGTVYVAHDPVLGRMVAIKLFSADVDLPDAGRRFAREARSAAALSHPNIVTVFDFGEFDSQPYIVMEYVQGDSLAHIIRSKADIPIIEKLRWLEGLAGGVGYAHRMSVVHRDIKPANLVLDRSGLLKILDFGIARMVGTASSTAMQLGTPGYMAPEQIKGEPVDQRVDIFAMGVVAYELLALRDAFPGEQAPTVMHRVMSEEPTPLGDCVPGCRPELTAIVERALKKQPHDRFESAEKMREAINRLRLELEAESGLTMVPTAPADPPAASARRLPIVAAAPPAADDIERRSTPDSGSRRTDRELLARRRAELLVVEVQSGRQHLLGGDLDAARESCLRALTVDDANPEALVLERDIEAARGSAETRAASSAVGGATRAIPFHPGSFTSPSEGIADGRTILRPPPPDDERTVFIRNTPAPVPMPAAPPPAIVADIPPATPLDAPARRDESAPARGHSVQAQRKRETASRRRWSPVRIAISAAASLALLAALAAALWRPNTAVPSGLLVIDAVPWGVVTSIQREGATTVPVPPSTSTPFSISLPPGDYRIVLTGPGPESRQTEVRAAVTSQTTTIAPTTQFQALTADQYFEPYLGAGSDSPAVGPDVVRTSQP